MELHTLINSKIQGIVNTFVGHYPTEQEGTSKVYPYAEINFPNIQPNNSFSDKNSMVIDIWDNKDTDVREIESLTDSIHKALNKIRYNDAFMNVNINRDIPYRLSLPDPSPNIQRRQLRYTVKVYYK